jgi:hypothetical protein
MDDVAPFEELVPMFCAGESVLLVPGSAAGMIGVASYVPIRGRDMK